MSNLKMWLELELKWDHNKNSNTFVEKGFRLSR